MFITQLEYREKTSATNWKRMAFAKQMNFVSEDCALPQQLLQIIAALADFGANKAEHRFANGIARIRFQAAHNDYMWFAKSTVQDGSLLIDEEELYDSGDTLLMRRAFGEWTINDQPAGEIPVAETMLAQRSDLNVLQKLQHGFTRVLYVQPTDNTLAEALEQIGAVPHGTMILLNGSALSTPLEVSAIAQRSDIQLLTVNCTGIANYTLVQKGKNIAMHAEKSNQ